MNNNARRNWLCMAVAVSLFMAACGGGDGSDTTASSGAPAVPAAPASPTPAYTISGTLTGLTTGATLTLTNNGSDKLSIAADGAFSFANPVMFNTGYAIAIGKQPLWQICSIANGGGTATANVSNVAVTCAVARAAVSTLAGSTTPDAVDGTGSAASFFHPKGVAVDANGNVYVADTENNEIRKITPAGVVTTLAGQINAGSNDGTGRGASFNWPTGVAVDANGNVYVADYGNNKIRKITPGGVVTTLAGSNASGSADGIGPAASFRYPSDIAVDASSNVYVADTGNNEIRKITPAGIVTTPAGTTAKGSADGVGNAASFYGPYGVAVDANGNVYVADRSNHEIRKVTPGGVVTTLAGSTTMGSADGVGNAAAFAGPSGVEVDAAGNVYVADSGNFEIRKITPAGIVTTLAGSTTQGTAEGIGPAASFNLPWGLAVDASGNVYVADHSNNMIRKITPTP